MSKVLFVVSPTLNALVDPRKGTTGNKIDCAAQHFKNGVTSNVMIGTTVGATALIGAAAAKNAAKASPELATKLANSGAMKKFFTYLNAAPKGVKIAAAAVTALLVAIRSYKAGTIEQKYIDRAQFVDHTFDEKKTAASSIKK